jgi:hypothetical protein
MINAESTQILPNQEQLEFKNEQNENESVKIPSPALKSQRMPTKMPSKIDLSSMLPSNYKLSKKLSKEKVLSATVSPDLAESKEVKSKKRSLSSIQRLTTNSNGTISAFRGIAVKSTLEPKSSPLKKVETQRHERKITHKFEDTLTKQMFDDYFEVVKKHKKIHQ